MTQSPDWHADFYDGQRLIGNQLHAWSASVAADFRFHQFQVPTRWFHSKRKHVSTHFFYLYILVCVVEYHTIVITYHQLSIGSLRSLPKGDYVSWGFEQWAYRDIVPTQTLFTHNDDWTTTMSDSNPYDLRAKYTHFRILVIGRANAGKTTLLQRVCNTTEDPCIYDNDKNLVSVQRPKDDKFWFWLFQLAWTYFGCTPFIINIYLCPDPTHISEGYTILIGRSHSRATPNLSSTILLDSRRATRSNCGKYSRLWRRKHCRRK